MLAERDILVRDWFATRRVPERTIVASGTGMNRPCLDCGAVSSKSRCRACESLRQAKRSRARTAYQGNWEAEAKRTVQLWVSEHGFNCPGLSPADLPEGMQHRGRPPHPATDLTCDHLPGGGRRVLCRSCNSSLGRIAPVHPHR